MIEKMGQFNSNHRDVDDIIDIPRITDIKTGTHHAVFLTNDNQALTQGIQRKCGSFLPANYWASVDEFPRKIETRPTSVNPNANGTGAIPSHDKIVAIECGERHSLLLNNRNEIIAFGFNAHFGEISLSVMSFIKVLVCKRVTI